MSDYGIRALEQARENERTILRDHATANYLLLSEGWVMSEGNVVYELVSTHDELQSAFDAVQKRHEKPHSDGKDTTDVTASLESRYGWMIAVLRAYPGIVYIILPPDGFKTLLEARARVEGKTQS